MLCVECMFWCEMCGGAGCECEVRGVYVRWARVDVWSRVDV